MNNSQVLDTLLGFWNRNTDAVITTTAVAILILVSISAWRFSKTKVKSRVLSNLATVMTLGWESQGVWHTATDVQQIPTHVAVFFFAVYEILQTGAMLKAEEDRREKGHPGWSGRFMFAIAITAGVYAALGEDTTAGVFQRIGLPVLVISYYYAQLIADRIDETAKALELRKKAKEKRESDDDTVWVNPLVRIFIKLGIKKPRGTKKNDAEREYLIGLMVTYGYRVYAGTFPRRFHLWRLRTIGGESGEEAALEARKRLDQKIRIDEILLPGGTRRGGRKQSTGQSPTIQSTAQLDSRPAVGAPVSHTSQLTSRLPVGQLTAQLPTGVGRLPVATDGASQSVGTTASQSGGSQSTATGPFPTDNDGLKDRLRQLIETGVVRADPIDGTVTVADARRAFSPDVGPMCGPDKARRLLREMNLYREPTTTRGVVMRRPEDPTDDTPPQRVNGNAPDLAG